MDSPELEAARSAVDKAVKEFVNVWSKERSIDEPVYVVAWAGFAEYVTTSYLADEVSGNCVVVPDDQHASTSRGLFEFGADAYSRAKIGS